MDPYNEGFTVDRTKDHENPYVPGTPHWNMWEDGYEDAQGSGNSPWLNQGEIEGTYHDD